MSVNTVIVLDERAALEKMGTDLHLIIPTNDYMALLEGILGDKLLASFMLLFPDIAKFCYS